MSQASGKVSFSLQPSFDLVGNRRWLVVRFHLSPHLDWDMLPNPLALRSTINTNALADYTLKLGSPPMRGNRYRLHDIEIENQPISDLEVEISDESTRLRVDGILGLDFFVRFGEVCWSPRTGQVVLTSP